MGRLFAGDGYRGMISNQVQRSMDAKKRQRSNSMEDHDPNDTLAQFRYTGEVQRARAAAAAAATAAEDKPKGRVRRISLLLKKHGDTSVQQIRQQRKASDGIENSEECARRRKRSSGTGRQRRA
jgi:hypothetical protein